MKKWEYFVLTLLAMILILGGCRRNDEVEPGEPFVYYLNMEGTRIEKRAFECAGEDVEQELWNFVDALSQPDESGKFRSAIPEKVEVKRFKLENKKLDVYFSKAYRKMDNSQEILCRAAVVMTLTQIEEVELVKFYIEEEPLIDKKGTEIGYMNKDDFVQNTGESLSSFQKVKLVLFLPNEEGKTLVKSTREIRYNSNVSVEKVVVEQLMQKQAFRNGIIIVPPETKLLGVTVKDKICYVNFDDGLLATGYLIDPELSIYSIVNSIIKNGTATQVQIAVNGKTDVEFQNSIDLGKPISAKWDIVEE